LTLCQQWSATSSTDRAGDQKAGSKALMEATGALAGIPYWMEWKEFPQLRRCYAQADSQ